MDSKETSESKVGKNSNFLSSLRHALDGIVTIFKEERNMRYHVLFGLLPLGLAVFFRVSGVEWILLIFCIFFVILMEFLNTIFETIVDLIVDKNYHILAKRAKDIAAGSVLVTAIFTVIVASIIFLPKFWKLYQEMFNG